MIRRTDPKRRKVKPLQIGGKALRDVKADKKVIWEIKKAVFPRLPGRPGVSALARPEARYRVDLATYAGKRFFETIGRSRQEDQLRVRGLRQAGLPPSTRRRARRLAALLDAGASQGHLPLTLASSLYLRDLRLRLTGALWRLNDEQDPERTALVTLIPRNCSLPLKALSRFNMAQAKQRLRSALNRAGAAQAGGGLILFLHGEYNPATMRYQLHWHGWASGGMIAVLNHLRSQANFGSSKTANANDDDGVFERIKVTRKPIHDQPYALSYLLQAFWPARATGKHLGSEEEFRQRTKHRIAEPYHSRVLLWLARHRIEDITLCIGMSVVNGRLQLRNGK